MQQHITPTEACDILSRVLQTIQTLNQARVFLAQQERQTKESTVQKAVPVLTAVEESRVVATPEIRPTLTIKLADLVREGAKAQERRSQRNRPVRQLNRERQYPRKAQPLREVRTIEVVYRRAQKMAS